MKIAVLNETSAGDRNADILAALEGRGHEIINAGMKKTGAAPELTYIHTGFMAALLLAAGRADMVVGGCGTGIGFMNSVLQYPGVVCGLIARPLDAWIFAQINGGNCIALQLLYEYGWAGDANLRFIFDSLFSVEFGTGYPPHRSASQKESRSLLTEVSRRTHHAMPAVISLMPDAVLSPALAYPGFLDIIDINTMTDGNLKGELLKRMK
jgi:ribose 5-phosphate isomerase RpiB